jgi:hypothetical protein
VLHNGPRRITDESDEREEKGVMSSMRSQVIRFTAVSVIGVFALAGCGGGSNSPSVSKRCIKHPQWKICKGTSSTTAP